MGVKLRLSAAPGHGKNSGKVLGWATLRRWVRYGKFPPPRIAFGRQRWAETDVEAFPSGSFEPTEKDAHREPLRLPGATISHQPLE